MNGIAIFENKEFGQVRTVTVEDKPFFVAKDVATALGYADTTNAIKQHCRWVAKHHLPHPQSKTKTLEVNVIPEGDIYRLVAHSELPEAEKFESWVFDEVLPTIRKTGGYIPSDGLSDDEVMAKALMIAQKTISNKDKLIAVKDQQIAELKPKADYTDRILQSKSLVNANQIAKDYGMSAKTFNKTLHNLGVQYSQGGQWLLYSKHQKKGYTSSETFEFERSNGVQDVNMRTKWTQKGRLFIYELLKTNGILPLIEQEKVS